MLKYVKRLTPQAGKNNLKEKGVTKKSQKGGAGRRVEWGGDHGPFAIGRGLYLDTCAGACSKFPVTPLQLMGLVFLLSRGWFQDPVRPYTDADRFALVNCIFFRSKVEKRCVGLRSGESRFQKICLIFRSESCHSVGGSYQCYGMDWRLENAQV